MSNWNDIGFIQQGWQCPVCGAVYSPMTMACMNCTGWKVSNMYRTSTGNADNDVFNKYLNHSAIKPVEEDKRESISDNRP